MCPTPESENTRLPIDIGRITYALGWFWPHYLLMAGLFSDHHPSIPFYLKVALTAITLLLPVLMITHGGKCGCGCAAAFLLYATLAVFLMWEFN